MKNKYYSRVLKNVSNPSTCPNVNSYHKHIQTIFLENEFSAVFKEKAEIFDSHFSKQCTSLNNKEKIQFFIGFLKGW